MNPEKNKYLKIKPSCFRTPITDTVIARLEHYFEKYKHYVWVTSVRRDSQGQLNVIRDYAEKKGIDKEFSEIKTCQFNDTIMYEGREIYSWQRTWSKLLSVGILINPPMPAEVLFDYIRYGVNKKGETIQPSSHFYGKAFDIGGGTNLINDEVEIVSEAISDDSGLGIKNIVIERENNCLHVNCL